MKIITVKMSKDATGSPDGCIVRAYETGSTYDLPADLANAFIGMKVAKVAKEEVVKEEVKAKQPKEEVIEGLGPK